MNRSTEAEFLATAGSLTGFLEAARTISSDAHTFADAIAGESGEAACRALQGVLDRAAELEKHAGSAGQLAGMRDSITRIRRSLMGFEHVGPSFQVMATLAQIETAHLGSAGVDLGYLAAEFRSAGDSIRERVAQVLGRAAEIEKRIESALRDALQFDERSLEALPALVTGAREGLAEFRRRQHQSTLAAAQLGGQSERFAQSIAEIVASIQFHDITRQQLEHVIESLNQLIAESPDGSPFRLPASSSTVIELQLGQLESARSAFSGAIQRMDRLLDAVAGQIAAMVSESAALLGRADSREGSFYARMESCFRTIADTAAGCRSLARRTQDTAAGLKGTLATLEQSAGEIHAVEWRLRRLAINAAISAAHIGAGAEPLEAVAAAMGRLLMECEHSSGEADTAIRAIVEAIRSVAEPARETGSPPGDAPLDQLKSRIDELHDLNSRTAGRTCEIASIASRLAAEVAALRQGISARQVFASTTASCCETLRGLKRLAAEAETPGGSDALLKLEQRYTMHAEREVHQSVMSPTGPAAPVEAEAPQSDSEFGENVELF